MPLLTVKTSVTRPAAAEVESLLLEISGRIARYLGKPEAYVMTAFEGEVPMTFAGSTTEPVCYLELKSVGTFSPAKTQAISADLCALIEERLGVPAARTYIEFTGAEGHLWGWNGGTFG
jgi:phenylpyruvate tautomerase PptA (4-oxalocrotonate tautomerase family)